MTEAELIEANTPLVYYFASLAKARLRGGAIDYDDLVQAGLVGLLHAIRRFDPSLGVKFSTYAGCCVRTSITHEIRTRRDTIRISESLPWQEREAISERIQPVRLPTESRAAKQGREPACHDRGPGLFDLRDEVEHILSRLTPDRRRAAEHFLAGKSQVSIARELGCSRSNVWALLRASGEQLKRTPPPTRHQG